MRRHVGWLFRRWDVAGLAGRYPWPWRLACVPRERSRGNVRPCCAAPPRTFWGPCTGGRGRAPGTPRRAFPRERRGRPRPWLRARPGL